MLDTSGCIIEFSGNDQINAPDFSAAVINALGFVDLCYFKDPVTGGDKKLVVVLTLQSDHTNRTSPLKSIIMHNKPKIGFIPLETVDQLREIASLLKFSCNDGIDLCRIKAYETYTQAI
jgi:hypothetical protein